MPEETLPPAVTQFRQQMCSTFHLSDPDEDGARTLTVETNSPDKWVFYLPEELCDHLKERFNGGIVVAGAGAVAALAKDKA